MKHKSGKTKKARREATRRATAKKSLTCSKSSVSSKPAISLPITTPAQIGFGCNVVTICISKDDKGSLFVNGQPAILELYNGLQLRLRIFGEGGILYIIFDKFDVPAPIEEMHKALK